MRCAAGTRFIADFLCLSVCAVDLAGGRGPVLQRFGNVGAADSVGALQIRERCWQHTFHCERLAEINNGIQLVVVIFYCLASAEVTSQLGFHQAIGVVIAVYVSCKVPGLQCTWRRTIGAFAHVSFIPIFFVCSGLRARAGCFHNLILGCG